MPDQQLDRREACEHAQWLLDHWTDPSPYHASAIGCARDVLAYEAALAEAEQERDLAVGWLGEPCAECGHIDWRADPNPALEWLERAVRAEEQLAALRSAVSVLSQGPLRLVLEVYRDEHPDDHMAIWNIQCQMSELLAAASVAGGGQPEPERPDGPGAETTR